MAYLKSCCCCISTFRGSIIIGALVMVFHMFALAIPSFFIHVWPGFERQVSAFARYVRDVLVSSSANIGFVNNFLNAAAEDMYAVLVGLVVYLVIIILLCALLIAGVCLRSRYLMLPWLVLTLLRLLTGVAFIIIYFYVVANVPIGRATACNIANLVYFGIAEVFDIVIMSYFWLVVFSHYKILQQLKEKVYPSEEEEDLSEVNSPAEDTEKNPEENIENNPAEDLDKNPDENNLNQLNENVDNHSKEDIEKS